MITFAYPILLCLWLFPLLILKFLPEHKEHKSSIKLPFFHDLVKLTGINPKNTHTQASSWSQRLTVYLAWSLLIIALARPQLIEEPLTKTIASRDLLLAVDLSGSMETKDFQDKSGENVTRLDSVKEVLRDFLAERQGDRVGLIFFGSAAFIQMPFTEDLDICQELMDEAQVRMAGPQTKLGDAIGLSISIFNQCELKDKVLILLTDGNDTGSLVAPEKAAQIARDKGIVIHTVAVGDPAAAGEQALDEVTLKNISKLTEGTYFWAGNRKDLAGIYDEIDKIGTRELDTISHRPKQELYHLPLAAFLLLVMLYHFYKLYKISRHITKSKALKHD
jgi:Ca-activated chloride channel homolog